MILLEKLWQMKQNENAWIGVSASTSSTELLGGFFTFIRIQDRESYIEISRLAIYF